MSSQIIGVVARPVFSAPAHLTEIYTSHGSGGPPSYDVKFLVEPQTMADVRSLYALIESAPETFQLQLHRPVYGVLAPRAPALEPIRLSPWAAAQSEGVRSEHVTFEELAAAEFAADHRVERRIRAMLPIRAPFVDLRGPIARARKLGQEGRLPERIWIGEAEVRAARVFDAIRGSR